MDVGRFFLSRNASHMLLGAGFSDRSILLDFYWNKMVGPTK